MRCRLLLIKGWKSARSIQGKLLILELPHQLCSQPPTMAVSQKVLLLFTPFNSLSWRGLQHLLPHLGVHQAAWCMVDSTSWECWCFYPASLLRWISNQSKLQWSSQYLPAFKSTFQTRLNNLWTRAPISEERLYEIIVDSFHFNLYIKSDIRRKSPAQNGNIWSIYIWLCISWHILKVYTWCWWYLIF